MTEFTFTPGDVDATRRFLAAQQPKKQAFFLMKDQDLLTAEDRRFFTCSIHYVVAFACMSEKRDYGFSFGIYSLPSNDDLRGIDDVVRKVEVPIGYEVQGVEFSDKRTDGGTAVVVHYGPAKSVSIDNALAFQFHIESFCGYAGRVLDDVVGSRVEWRVPAKNFYFLAGQLPVYDPGKVKK